MTAELGFLALLLALASALTQSASVFLGKRASARTRFPLAITAAQAQAAAALAAFAFLLMSFASSDFSVVTVVANSHSTKPIFYKIAATWGNHEGSMLLWALLLSLYGAFYASVQSAFSKESRIALGIMGLLSAGVFAFIAFASNPFLRVAPAPVDGRGLNPLLQDIGLIIHPPILYMGYVGMAVPFALALAGLVSGQINADWARRTKPWAMTAFGFLTLGIGLGSWWAYRELGWGGYWFWDPVENASLLPWLIGGAMVHSLMVLERRGGFANWTVILAITGFSLSLIGTFIVRSGLITSVHAFAVDPARGLAILFYLVIVIGGATLLFLLYRKPATQTVRFSPASREAMILINNLVMSTTAATILLGTLYPLLIDAFNGAPLSVGAPFYDATALPLFVVGMAAMGLVPLALWRKGSLMQALGRGRLALTLALIAATLTYVLHPHGILGPLAMGAAVFIAAGVGQYGYQRQRSTMRMQDISLIMGHLGLAIAAIGMVGTALFSSETTMVVRPGQIVELGHIKARFDGITQKRGANFIADRAKVDLLGKDGKVSHTLYPERRYYPASKMPTTEAAIYSTPLSDLHVTVSALTDKDGQKTRISGWALRLYLRPLIGWIWTGCALAGFGILLGALAAARALSRQRMQAKLSPTPEGAMT